MPLTLAEIQTMSGRGVVVAAHTGHVISRGSFSVSAAPDGGGLRVDLHFETPKMTCVLRVPASRFTTVASTWDGAAYQYVLPVGDVWQVEPAARVGEPGVLPPIIESFPLPPTRATGPATAPLKKWKTPDLVKP
jgi:hypothetical protein